MKIVNALSIAALFAALVADAGCKDPERPVKAQSAAKSGEPARPTPAAPPAPSLPAAAPAPTPPAPAPAAAAAGTEAATSSIDIDDLGAQSLALAEKFAKVIAEAGEDCGKVGQGLRALSADLRANSALDKQLKTDEAKQREYVAKYQTRVNELIQGALPVVQKCMTNADVKNAMTMPAQ